MADCVSLPNAAELVEYLRSDAKELSGMVNGKVECNVLWKAADAIEAMAKEIEYLREQAQRGSDYRILKSERDKLLAENAKLKAERDAAMRTIPHDCNTCNYDCPISIAHKALFSKNCDRWEWRGVPKEEEE